MDHTRLLDYLFSCNNIPVWLLGEDGIPAYHSENAQRLRPPEEIRSFFERFIQTAGETPTLYCVNGTELFAFFRCDESDAPRTAVIGPVFSVQPVYSSKLRHSLSIDYLYNEDAAKMKVLLTPSVDADVFVRFVCVIAELLSGRQYSENTLKRSLNDVSLRFIFNRALMGKLFNLREEIEAPSHDYEMEQRYLRAVRDGDTEKLHSLPKLTVLPVKNELSPDPHRQFLYEMIALVTLVTRAAIEGGLDIETAYTMSDLYIRQMDGTKNTQELLNLSRNISLDFAQKIKEEKLNAPQFRHRSVQKCITYIRTHLHLPITLQELAEYAGLNDKYLSRLFIRETGMKLSYFIQRERVIEAKALLEYSDHSLLDISNYLAFSSQSYFIKVFKQHTGMTPQQYQDQLNK